MDINKGFDNQYKPVRDRIFSYIYERIRDKVIIECLDKEKQKMIDDRKKQIVSESVAKIYTEMVPYIFKTKVLTNEFLAHTKNIKKQKPIIAKMMSISETYEMRIKFERLKDDRIALCFSSLLMNQKMKKY